MRSIASLFVLILLAFGCNTTRLYNVYKLYHRDKYFNYPEEKLIIKFNSDTTGEFINKKKNGKVINQDFTFSRVNNDYLIVDSVDLPYPKNISLKQGDTIVLANRRLLFFYNGDKKYLLSFKGSK